MTASRTMRRWCAGPLALVISLGGCDDKAEPAGPRSGAANSQAAQTRGSQPARSQPAGARGAVPASTTDDDDELETVDDTVPPDDAVEDASAEGDDDSGDKPEDACAPKQAGLKPMQVLRFTFSDGVEGKDPKSRLNVAKAGQRVYAHLAMRNRSGKKRCLHLTFRVGGKKRTQVTVPIGKSWEWRTYAYNTLRGDDNRPLELTVIDDQGALVLKKMLPVIPKKK